MNKPYYLPIQVDNLEIIRSRVLDIIPPILLESSFINYDPVLSDQLLSMPEIISAVEQFGGLDQVERVMFNTMQPYSEYDPHCDFGERRYSFNIPILNFRNTYLTIFSLDSELLFRTYVNVYGNTVRYYDIDVSKSELLDTIETANPHVLDTKYPHGVQNPNPTTRLNMLIRLKNSATLNF